jgi:RNA polymerase sigma-70 factor, ECF subfamily
MPATVTRRPAPPFVSETTRQDGPATPADDESGLVDRARRGDVDAFEGLYRRHVGRVFAICLRMSGDRIRAAELTQDTFVRLWERLESFRGESALSSWIHRMAVNVVLAAARSDNRRTARVGLAEDDRDGEDGGPWEGMVRPESTDERIDLEAAIAALPPGARRVFVLHDIEGYRHEEIARITGNAEGTLRAQLHRARKLLMEALTR